MDFLTTNFRAIMLWGGPGTTRMLRIKFPGKGVDDKTHEYAHSIEAAERVAEMGFNWAFLAYNWGFPPEIEEQDWISFESTLHHFHDVGVKVIGYIQTSNCVMQGSYEHKDWYAEDADGRKIPFYGKRYFTSLAHAGWLGEVRDRVRKLVDTGADGVYFDNPWQGGIGIDIAEMPLGFIGSYDIHSQNAYGAAFNGAPLPRVLDVSDPKTQQYLRWRVQLAVSAMRDWAQTARDLKPDIVVLANNFDAIVRNSYVEMGMDLEGLADVQDVVMVENFSLPRIQDDDSVIANAITISAAQARVDKPVATLPYIAGIGFDRMWQPRQFSRMIAEGLAMNSPVVIRGTTFLHRGDYTLLLHKRYEKQHDAIRRMYKWLEKQDTWLNQRKPCAALAVYHPFEAMHWQWNRTAPFFFAACQIIIQHGLPLRIVGDDDDWTGVTTLIVPPGEVPGLDSRLARFTESGGRLIDLGTGRRASNESAIWYNWTPIPHRVPHWKWLRRRMNDGAGLSWRLYHRSRLARMIAERFDLTTRTTQSPMFFPVPEPQEQELLAALGTSICPRVESDYPMLLTGWQEPDETQQWHLVNYADDPQKVILDMGELVKASVYAVGDATEPNNIVGSALMLTVDIAKIVRIEK
jgi:hypothetical protein